MRFLSLFAGIGGFDLGLERAGMECVGQVENDPYCIKVLEKHWPDVPRWGDIRDVTEETLAHTYGCGWNAQPLPSAKRSQQENNINLNESSQGGRSRTMADASQQGIKEPANADGIDLICGGFP